MMHSIGTFAGVFVYFSFFKSVEAWKVITLALCLNLIEASLMYVNVMRWNITYLGISDFSINLTSMLLGKASLVCFCELPMEIMMMNVVPRNIEASMFAIIAAIFEFPLEWGADISGGFWL
jgi:hypothetical protein